MFSQGALCQGSGFGVGVFGAASAGILLRYGRLSLSFRLKYAIAVDRQPDLAEPGAVNRQERFRVELGRDHGRPSK